MFFVIAVLTGILLGLLIPYNLSATTLPYVAVAIIAALDSVFGGLAANLNKRFNMNVFMMGLFSNAVLAVLLTYVGNLLGISLYFAVIVVFGVRIFNNLAAIRRMTFDIYFAKRAHEKERRMRLAISEKSVSHAESDENVEEDDSAESDVNDEEENADSDEKSELAAENEEKQV